jgi:hypothetical protein
MAKKPKQKKSTFGRRKVTTEKNQKKREQNLIKSSASSWLRNFRDLIWTANFINDILDWMKIQF